MKQARTFRKWNPGEAEEPDSPPSLKQTMLFYTLVPTACVFAALVALEPLVYSIANNLPWIFVSLSILWIAPCIGAIAGGCTYLDRRINSDLPQNRR